MPFIFTTLVKLVSQRLKMMSNQKDSCAQECAWESATDEWENTSMFSDDPKEQFKDIPGGDDE